MRFGALRHLAVLASLSLLMSGQLCMLTTCVPRLREAGAAPAHSCCRTDPGRDTPRAPFLPGTMSCDQVSSLTDATTPVAPEPFALAPARAPESAPALAMLPAGERLELILDSRPLPGRDGPATAGLRAPPLA